MTNVTKLSNGITVITEEMPWMNHATVGVWVGSGSYSENKENNGIAHFLEHMAFKGTTNHTSKEIAGSIESRGGSINAYTSEDRTVYYATVLPDDVPNAIDLFGDIIHNSKYAQEDIDMERNVIVQEIAMYRDMASAEAGRINMEMVYPDHPMGRSILGTEENVMGFKHQDFVDFVSHNYYSSNIYVCVAGPIKPEYILPQIEGLFGFMTDADTNPLTDAIFNPSMIKTTTKHEQTHAIMNFKGVGSANPRFYTNKVAIGSIGGGMSSRLFQEVREKRGLCYTIQAHAYANNKSCGGVILYSGTGNDTVDELVDVASDLILRSVNDITQPEIDQAKSILKADTLMRYDSTSGRIEKAVADMREFGRVRDAQEIIDQIDAIDINAVKKELETICQSDFAYSVYGGGVGNRTVDELSEHFKKG